jgi:hypothetical protein
MKDLQFFDFNFILDQESKQFAWLQKLSNKILLNILIIKAMVLLLYISHILKKA